MAVCLFQSSWTEPDSWFGELVLQGAFPAEMCMSAWTISEKADALLCEKNMFWCTITINPTDMLISYILLVVLEQSVEINERVTFLCTAIICDVFFSDDWYHRCRFRILDGTSVIQTTSLLVFDASFGVEISYRRSKLQRRYRTQWHRQIWTFSKHLQSTFVIPRRWHSCKHANPVRGLPKVCLFLSTWMRLHGTTNSKIWVAGKQMPAIVATMDAAGNNHNHRHS